MKVKIELQNIEKSFGDKKVLSNIELCAESGKALGLLGRNGAGKTTTIRIIMGVFPADSGKILIDGAERTPGSLKVGYLPEERGLYPKKKIIDQLVYFAELKGMSKKDALISIDSWLERLGMAEYRNKRLDTLSKGNQQKIQLITAVDFDPELIILDEPFSGLDPVNAMLLKDVVKDEISKGKIVIFSSHQMNYIEEFCDDIAILNSGKIVLSGNLNKIKKDYPRDTIEVISADNKKIREYLMSYQVTEEKEKLLIKLHDATEKAELMQRLTEKFDIDLIKVYEPSLNDVFVEYTEGGI